MHWDLNGPHDPFQLLRCKGDSESTGWFDNISRGDGEGNRSIVARLNRPGRIIKEKGENIVRR